jgi:hypothetical protein
MMNKPIMPLLALLWVSESQALEPLSFKSPYNDELLPSPFPVYVIENQGVVNHPYPGAKKVLLPTDNSYSGKSGCYVACYSHRSGIYAVSPDISVMGQVRVPGEYIGRICQPKAYEWQDISQAEAFSQLCAQKIKGCAAGDCWAGGDTGGWFGIQ